MWGPVGTRVDTRRSATKGSQGNNRSPSVPPLRSLIDNEGTLERMLMRSAPHLSRTNLLAGIICCVCLFAAALSLSGKVMLGEDVMESPQLSQDAVLEDSESTNSSQGQKDLSPEIHENVTEKTTALSTDEMLVPDKAGAIEYVLVVRVNDSVEHWEALRSTWLKNLTSTLGVIVYGNPDRSFVFPKSENGVVISTRSEATPWAELQTSLKKGLEQYPLAKFFAIFNHTNYVYTKRLVATTIELNKDYLGFPLRKPNNTMIFADGTAGFILSRNATDTVVTCSIGGSGCVDVDVGQCLGADKINTILTTAVGLHSNTPRNVIHWDIEGHPESHVVRSEPLEAYAKPLSYSAIDPSLMMKMHDDYYRHGSLPVRKPLPRIVHQVWVGNRKPPEGAIETCRTINGNEGWTHILHGNETNLINQKFYDRSLSVLNLLSDIARIEYLLETGGVYVDADIFCLKPFEIIAKETDNTVADGFCAYESEKARADLVASSVLGMRPYSPTAMVVVSQLHKTDWSLPAWQSAGPLYLTKMFQLVEPGMRYYPSNMFYPYHFTTPRTGKKDMSLVFTDQVWGTTTNIYQPGRRRLRGNPRRAVVMHLRGQLQ